VADHQGCQYQTGIEAWRRSPVERQLNHGIPTLTDSPISLRKFYLASLPV